MNNHNPAYVVQREQRTGLNTLRSSRAMKEGFLQGTHTRFNKPLGNVLAGYVIPVVMMPFLLLCLGSTQRLQAQPTSDPLVIPRISEKIELDGRPDESAWQQARTLPAVQHKPHFGKEPSQQTTFLIGYTRDYIYAGFRCKDTAALSAPSFKRDYMGADSDGVILILDTFNDNESGVAFLASPTGQRTDFSISQDATGSQPIDASWNTFWDAEAQRTAEGWTAEMRIPVSTLRFDKKNGKVVMGLSMHRFLARTQEHLVYPPISPKWGLWSIYKPSQTRDVVFEELQPDTPLRVTPYLLGGLGQENVLNDSETEYVPKTDPAYDAGLDVKYGITGNYTLDLTVNTDFAQAEADNQQVNLSRFPLFFPEKRRFFLERATTFSFGLGGVNRLFYSRRIGIANGKQVRILGGARLVGRSGPWDIGVLSMQTAREPDIIRNGEPLPSENFGVVRIQREAINKNSNIGGMLTSRIGTDGSYNMAYGLDGLFNIHDQQYITAKWAQTFERGTPGTAFSLAPARIHLVWEDRSYEGLNYDFRYDRAGRRYHPGAGLELRDNYYRLGDRIGYGWVQGEDSPIQRQSINMDGSAWFRNDDGSLQSLYFGPRWEMTTHKGHSLIIQASRQVEDVQSAFSLSQETEVPAGRYGFSAGQISYTMPPGWKLRANITFSGGGYYDGHRQTFQVAPTWNASRFVKINGFYQYNRIRFPDRGNAFDAHIGRLRAEITPNVEYSLSTFIQYNSAQGSVTGNLRFRYNPRQGNDLYLVYNENLNSNRPVDNGPRLPLSNERTILVKYTYTFNW